MVIRTIKYNAKFEWQFLLLPKKIQVKAFKTERLFHHNPFHPSLRLHKLEGNLKGSWSISIDKRYRIIFKIMDNGVVLFVSAGLHAIYER